MSDALDFALDLRIPASTVDHSIAYQFSDASMPSNISGTPFYEFFLKVQVLRTVHALASVILFREGYWSA